MSSLSNPILEIRRKIRPKLKETYEGNYPVWVKYRLNPSQSVARISFSFDSAYIEVPHSAIRNLMIPFEEKKANQVTYTLDAITSGLHLISKTTGFGLIVISLRRARLNKKVYEHTVEVRISIHTRESDAV